MQDKKSYSSWFFIGILENELFSKIKIFGENIQIKEVFGEFDMGIIVQNCMIFNLIIKLVLCYLLFFYFIYFLVMMINVFFF